MHVEHVTNFVPDLLQMMKDEFNKVIQLQGKTGAPAVSSPKDRKRRREEEPDVSTALPLTAVLPTGKFAETEEP